MLKGNRNLEQGLEIEIETDIDIFGLIWQVPNNDTNLFYIHALLGILRLFGSPLNSLSAHLTIINGSNKRF